MEEITMTFKQYAVMVAVGCLGLYAVVLLAHQGALTVPNPERAALTGARAVAHAELERLESVVPAGRVRDGGLWKTHLHIVETELASGHVDVAVRAWHDAYGAALESRGWESMIAVGDAFMKIGHAAGTPNGARMNAREAYLTALIRARRNRSVDGALRSGEAFAGLGDRAIVEQSLYIAAQLAAGDEQAQQRVGEARQRWAGRQTVAGS
jgi:hypothetical protein